MKLTAQELARQVAATGFHGDSLEKAFRLMGLLDSMHKHPFLETRIALKGGTALNLFHFDVPRLSVDIDLNYIGAIERDAMLADKPKLEQAVQAVCSREGLTVKRLPSEHAGGKWRLTYLAANGGSGNLELDVNFMLRTPLWPPTIAECFPLGAYKASPVPMLDVHELAAGKLAALLARSAERDIFDAHRLLAADGIDRAKLRLAFVVYGGINRKDWRTVSVDDVKSDVEAAWRELVPTLRKDLAPSRTELRAWHLRLVTECKERLGVVLPLAPNELDFLERLNGAGEIVSSLLTGDDALRVIIQQHPGLLWKAQNVRHHLAAAAKSTT